MVTRRQAIFTGAASIAIAAAKPAIAKEYPARPLKIIVPIAAGGSNDFMARMLADQLAPRIGQPIVVENRPGAGGNLGGNAVAKSPADGYTLLLASTSVLCGNKWLYGSNVPFDPLKELAPVTRLAQSTIMLVVNASKGWRTLDDLIAYAKKNPGRLTMGSSGTGTISHLYMDLLTKKANISAVHVPYRGGSQAITDLLAGSIDMMFDAIPINLPYLREGRFRALAVGSASRVTGVPEIANVPGMSEALPGSGIDARNWYSITVPAGTPQSVIQYLNRELNTVMSNPAFAQRLKSQSIDPITDKSPDDLLRYWKEQEKLWKTLVEQSGASAT
ncbi:Bug family tripartite tricarboxylate transporter substrate binding protein [Comamonas testosteroni]|uniref:Bug family tripartite tricarboxylate transporter substrate binding protein n=1 Tax=Comamonas testosteroni TaxID=285 RepID=UPI0009B8AA96|nr:tripartite tricarboxylate transporter substrate binding protein [Comamonas testosteroni]